MTKIVYQPVWSTLPLKRDSNTFTTNLQLSSGSFVETVRLTKRRESQLTLKLGLTYEISQRPTYVKI